MSPEDICLHHISYAAVSYGLSYPILTPLTEDLETSYSFKNEPVEIACLAPLELTGHGPPQIFYYATWLQVA